MNGPLFSVVGGSPYSTGTGSRGGDMTRNTKCDPNTIPEITSDEYPTPWVQAGMLSESDQENLKLLYLADPDRIEENISARRLGCKPSINVYFL